MIKRFVTIIGLALILSGCATYATGPLFSEAPRLQIQKSILYIYRVNSPLVYTPIIKINDKPFVELSKLGYSYAYLSPGIYKITIDYRYLETPLITEFSIEENQEVFKRLYDSGFNKNLTDIPKEKALNEIKDFRYVEPLNTEF
jgi:hypothetical protein